MWKSSNLTCVLSVFASIPLALHGATIEGFAYEKNTQKGCADVVVKLEKDGTPAQETFTDPNGHFSFTVSTDGTYQLSYKKVAHTVVRPKDAVTVNGANSKARDARVFAKSAAVSADDVAFALTNGFQIQLNNDQIKESLASLSIDGGLDKALLAKVKDTLDKAHSTEFLDISIAELKQAISAKKVIIIDANGEHSFDRAHLPNALDYSKFKGELHSVLPADKDALVVAYCEGPTSVTFKPAALEAKAIGYTNIRRFSAGISGWMQAGEATEK
jgi:rhodanese-related sulfurtransferase